MGSLADDIAREVEAIYRQWWYMDKLEAVADAARAALGGWRRGDDVWGPMQKLSARLDELGGYSGFLSKLGRVEWLRRRTVATIVQRKHEAERAIVRLVKNYVDEHPEMRSAIIYGLTYRAMTKMTLKELREWQRDLEQGEDSGRLQ